MALVLRLVLGARAGGALATTARAGAAAAAGGAPAQGRRAYHKNVVDHYENPRNVGSFDKNDANVGTGLVGAPACGDVMKLQIKVDDEGNIVDSCFKTFGCGSAIASSSVATEWCAGGTAGERARARPTPPPPQPPLSRAARRTDPPPPPRPRARRRDAG